MQNKNVRLLVQKVTLKALKYEMFPLFHFSVVSLSTCHHDFFVLFNVTYPRACLYSHRPSQLPKGTALQCSELVCSPQLLRSLPINHPLNTLAKQRRLSQARHLSFPRVCSPSLQLTGTPHRVTSSGPGHALCLHQGWVKSTSLSHVVCK